MKDLKRIKEALADFKAEANDVGKVWQFTKDKHDATGAIRKHSGNPYFEHPESVAKLAVAYGGNDDQVTAAFLHDTLEDTDTSYDELKMVFGEKVADLVSEITNDRSEIDRVGKEEYINQELLSLSDDALFVKLCDMLHNCEDYPRESQKDRMARNIKFLKNARYLNDKQKELVNSIEMAVGENKD